MKNIIFDLGNVLIRWEPNVIYEDYFNNDMDKIKQFYKETNIHQVNLEMDAGRPFTEALSELANKFPRYKEAIYLWQSRWVDMITGTIEETVKILESLNKQNYPLYALSNWALETFDPYIRNNYHFFKYFKDMVISGEEGCVKPDPKIYNILLSRNNLKPEDCIFVDDSEKNVVTARNLGIHAIKFVSPEQLIEELKQHGIFALL